MKSRLLATAVLSTVIALSSCTRDGAGKSDNSTINSFEVRESIKSAAKSYKVAEDGINSYLTLSCSVQWPEQLGDNNIKALQDSIISYMFGESRKPTIDESITAFIDDTEQFSPTAKATPVDSVENDNPDMFNCWIDASARILELNEQSVTYEISNAGYAGGAHPNSSSHPFTYDLTAGKVLTAENMFKQGAKTSVLGIVAQALAEQLNTTPDRLTDAGLFAPLSSIGQPFILNNAVVFRYNPYEIAPYSMGTIDVTVYPYQLDEYLTPDARRLLDDEN